MFCLQIGSLWRTPAGRAVVADRGSDADGAWACQYIGGDYNSGLGRLKAPGLRIAIRRNPNLEKRNPKQIQINKSKCSKRRWAAQTRKELVHPLGGSWFWILGFEIVSDFVIRDSDFSATRPFGGCSPRLRARPFHLASGPVCWYPLRRRPSA